VNELRARFREARCHHLVIEEVVNAERAATVRAQIDAAGFARYYEPDRARYEVNGDHVEPALLDELRELAEQITERPLRHARATWLRLRHRDYALMKSDARGRLDDAHVEVTLDLSEKATEQAEIVYSDGRESWVVPQRPGSVCIVERESWLFRYERYLDLRIEDAVIYRLRLALLFT
jgi:hypothetical protein